jgi:hypothetical protein
VSGFGHFCESSCTESGSLKVGCVFHLSIKQVLNDDCTNEAEYQSTSDGLEIEVVTRPVQTIGVLVTRLNFSRRAR